MSDSAKVHSLPGSDVSGRGMDRKVDRSKQKMIIYGAAGAGVLVLVALLWAFRPAPAGTYVLKADRLQVAAAEAGMFDDSMQSLGAVQPANTVYLDVVQGGRVEKVLVESGDAVKQGQLLMVLSNPQVQLDAIGKESEVNNQLSTLRNQELDAERSRLTNARALLEQEATYASKQRALDVNNKLAAEGAYPQQRLIEDKADLEKQKKLLDILNTSQANDLKIAAEQLKQRQIQASRLQSNLRVSRENLDALNVRAPATGTLTAFEAELGESISSNKRIGQIDTPSDLKFVVAVDEYYLARFSPGLPAEAVINGKAWPLKVTRVSEQVTGGAFKTELAFTGEKPESLRRGQSFPVKVFLSESTQALLIPNGPFTGVTGGRWIYVVSADGSRAEKRDITIGRKNAGYIEVLSGLKPGEKVVVSEYDTFKDSNGLQIQN